MRVMGFYRWVLVIGVCWLGLGGCALPQVRAEDRLFLKVSVDLIDVVTLPAQTFEETPVGGLSAIAYDAPRNQFYALSDDRGGLAPSRFYTLEMPVIPGEGDAAKIQAVSLKAVTLLRNEAGSPYAPDVLDPEGVALSPRQSIFVTSEGVASTQSPPMLNEYDLATGRLKTQFRLPDRYLPKGSEGSENPPQGVRSNVGLEALTLSPTGGAFEPFRLFTATESALAQDFDPDPANPLTSRFLHYLIDPDQSTLISEHAYPLSLEPLGAVSNGLTELVALDTGGHFLGLERVYGIRGFEVKLWQLATGGATDTSAIAALPTPLQGITPIQKQLVLDFATLGLPIDNLEGMTLGPPFPDGSPSLWIISDNNFSEEQVTQVWLFRLRIG